MADSHKVTLTLPTTPNLMTGQRKRLGKVDKDKSNNVKCGAVGGGRLTLVATRKLGASRAEVTGAAEWHGRPSPRVRVDKGRKRRVDEVDENEQGKVDEVDENEEGKVDEVDENEGGKVDENEGRKRVKVDENVRTKPIPFSFECKDKLWLERREARASEKSREFEDKSVFLFSARPLPDLSQVRGVRPRGEPSITQPRPFQLLTNVRGERYSEWFAAKVEEMEEEEREGRLFKARPATALHVPPFTVESSKQQLTEAADVQLHTEVRCDERNKYDERAEAERRQLQRLREERERERAAEEEREERERREANRYRAQPIHHYQPLVVMPSTKPLTQPKSPQFSDRFTK